MLKKLHDIFKERIVTKFLVKSGKTGVEIMPMLNNVYGEVTMKKSAIYDWIQCFCDGREDANDDLGCGRHIETQTFSNVEGVKQLLDSDRHLSIIDVTDELSINHETIRLIVKDELRLWKLCIKLVSKNLTEEQKKYRVDICCDWFVATESENILECVITWGELWLFRYNPKTKCQGMQQAGDGEAWLKKARMFKSQVKTMLVAFFDKKDLIHKEFLRCQGLSHTKNLYNLFLSETRCWIFFYSTMFLKKAIFSEKTVLGTHLTIF